MKLQRIKNAYLTSNIEQDDFIEKEKSIKMQIEEAKIKELRKLDSYCKEIKKRSESIQGNLNDFDNDIQKEKDNFRKL